MPKEPKTTTQSRRSRPYNESFEESSNRHDKFLKALQQAMDTWTIPEEDLPPTESILAPLWDLLNGEPLGDATQKPPFNVIRESAMMAIKGPRNRLRVKLTQKEQAAYDDFLKDLEARRRRIAEEHFKSVRRSLAAAERAKERAKERAAKPVAEPTAETAASTEHECVGLNCAISGGKRSRKHKNNKSLYGKTYAPNKNYVKKSR